MEPNWRHAHCGGVCGHGVVYLHLELAPLESEVLSRRNPRTLGEIHFHRAIFPRTVASGVTAYFLAFSQLLSPMKLRLNSPEGMLGRINRANSRFWRASHQESGSACAREHRTLRRGLDIEPIPARSRRGSCLIRTLT